MFNLKLNNPELDQKSRIIYAGLFFLAQKRMHKLNEFAEEHINDTHQVSNEKGLYRILTTQPVLICVIIDI